MVLFQVILGFLGQINKKIFSIIKASNLSPLNELQSEELNEKNNKLDTHTYQLP